MCLSGWGDPWNGGICHSCLPPLRPYKSRRRARLGVHVKEVRILLAEITDKERENP
jgi:hypothetical protein